MRCACSPEKYLAAELERLMSLPLATPTDLENWYSAKSEVEGVLLKEYPDFQIWHEAQHFLDDGDIRIRDAGYRERQETLMHNYVCRLRASAPEVQVV